MAALLHTLFTSLLQNLFAQRQLVIPYIFECSQSRAYAVQDAAY